MEQNAKIYAVFELDPFDYNETLVFVSTSKESSYHYFKAMSADTYLDLSLEECMGASRKLLFYYGDQKSFYKYNDNMAIDNHIEWFESLNDEDKARFLNGDLECEQND